MPTSQPILFFDGVCNLCHGAVQWFLARDTGGTLRFASLQSELAQELLPQVGIDPAVLSSLVFWDGQRAYTHSAGALQAAKRLGGGWRLLSRITLIVPAFLRDGVYNFIAGNRYRWFGKQESCWLPRPEWKERFVG